MPVTNNASGIMPGTVAHFAAATAPDGWLKANGAAVSRTLYAALFTAIGTTYGVGDGATTFNVPDLRGEFVRGLDDGRGVDTGRAIGTAQAHDTQPHTHGSGAGAGWNFLSYKSGAGSGDINGAGSGVNQQASTASFGVAETRPRNVALMACIKY